MFDYRLPLKFAGQNPPPNSPRARIDRLDPSITSAHVLIIEDEMMIAWMIQSLIEDMGFTSIAVAADGEEALRMASEDAPGLVISDINLGVAPDGVETVARICATMTTKVMFVSGYANSDAKDRIERMIGGAQVLRKPIEAARLQNAVIELLGSKPN